MPLSTTIATAPDRAMAYLPVALFGSIMGLSNAVCIILLTVYGTPVLVAILAAVGVGLVCGLLNGLLICYVKSRPFITTTT